MEEGSSSGRSSLDGDESTIARADYNRLEATIGNEGFREGKIKADEKVMQEGFDIGFEVGMKIGRVCGNLYSVARRAAATNASTTAATALTCSSAIENGNEIVNNGNGSASLSAAQKAEVLESLRLIFFENIPEHSMEKSMVTERVVELISILGCGDSQELKDFCLVCEEELM